MYIKFVIIYLHVKIIIFTSKGIVMLKALVIENDQRLNSQYCSFLAKQGYDTVSAHDALDALSTIDSNSVNIVICDYDLPNIDGFMVIERIRANDEEVPILATSTQNDLKSKQRAFNAGCDDYLVKPVDLNELALRLSALLRRTRSTSNQRIVIGNAALDSSSLTVTEGSNVTALPPKEFLLLFKLCASPGRIFTRRDIMDDIWGIRTGTDERTVDVHIRRLRKRFEESASIQIETVRGVGYRAKATKVNS